MNIKSLIFKYREMISYLFFGGCTTLVNIVSYYVFYNLLNISNVKSAVIAWFISVLFAYVTNKIFVFQSKTRNKTRMITEMLSFFACRIITGAMDVAIMYVAVDLMSFNSLLWKIISNVLVIIANYVASKILIFKEKQS